MENNNESVFFMEDVNDLFHRLEDFYLMKAFEKPEYRERFNSGEQIYLNPLSYYSTCDNSFQKDDEGVIFRQAENGKIRMYATPSNMNRFLLENQILLEKEGKLFLNPEKSLEDMYAVMDKHGKYLGDTMNTNLALDGFLCCFTLIPKVFIEFQDKNFRFPYTDFSFEDFMRIFENYTENKDFAFVSVYDASSFIESFREGFYSKGYIIEYGPVKYEQKTEIDKIKAFQEQDFHSILFTKGPSYAYQKEFRIIVHSQTQDTTKPLVETGIDFRNHIVQDFAYLSRKYIEDQLSHT